MKEDQRGMFSIRPNASINYSIQAYIAAKDLIDTIKSYAKEDGSEENPRLQ